jgi:hypothetical protein
MIRKDFFQREDTHAVPLGVACHKLLGKQWMTYEPRTVYEELERLGYGRPPETNATKINAFRTAQNTILPWMDHETFEKVVLGLEGNLVSFELREPPNVAQLMVGVESLRAIQQVPFADEVKRYIAACVKHDELDYAPEPLTFVMPYVCPPMYRCLECGNTDEDDLEDGQCDVCVGRYEDGTNNGRPEVGLEDRGTQIERFMPFDYAPVATLYQRASKISIDHVQLGESNVELQVAKLLSYNEYRAESARRMNAQLREVVHVR